MSSPFAPVETLTRRQAGALELGARCATNGFGEVPPARPLREQADTDALGIRGQPDPHILGRSPAALGACLRIVARPRRKVGQATEIPASRENSLLLRREHDRPAIAVNRLLPGDPLRHEALQTVSRRAGQPARQLPRRQRTKRRFPSGKTVRSSSPALRANEAPPVRQTS